MNALHRIHPFQAGFAGEKIKTALAALMKQMALTRLAHNALALHRQMGGEQRLAIIDANRIFRIYGHLRIDRMSYLFILAGGFGLLAEQLRANWNHGFSTIIDHGDIAQPITHTQLFGAAIINFGKTFHLLGVVLVQIGEVKDNEAALAQERGLHIENVF